MPESIIAVIPAHDEAPRIGAVVEGALSHLPVLVVDDGSGDETASVAAAAGAEVVAQSPNQGKGAALRTAFRRALAKGCDAVVTLDGDGQHDPSEIPAFLAARGSTGAELIVGYRDFRRMPPTRRVANSLGGIAFSRAVGRPIADNQSGFRLVDRRLMEALLESREPGFEFEIEMIAAAIRLGLTIEWIPIRTIYAGESSHIRPVDHLRHFIRAVRAARRTVRTTRQR